MTIDPNDPEFRREMIRDLIACAFKEFGEYVMWVVIFLTAFLLLREVMKI